MWPVVPMSPGQRLDIREEDLVRDGDFRICDTYRGGGGYDRFPAIASALLGESGHHRQFVVQLHGCTLDCPYCYVTREGVWGKPVEYSTSDLVNIFMQTDASVFHLMGGAPAIYLRNWPDILAELCKCDGRRWVFHSDLLLNESRYSESLIKSIRHQRAIYAVDIKGVSADEYLLNTRKKLSESLFWYNMGVLETARPQYYFTFTNVEANNVEIFWVRFAERFGSDRATDLKGLSFDIDLIDYDSLPYVDVVPWGPRKHLTSGSD